MKSWDAKNEATLWKHVCNWSSGLHMYEMGQASGFHKIDIKCFDQPIMLVFQNIGFLVFFFLTPEIFIV